MVNLKRKWDEERVAVLGKLRYHELFKAERIAAGIYLGKSFIVHRICGMVSVLKLSSTQPQKVL